MDEYFAWVYMVFLAYGAKPIKTSRYSWFSVEFNDGERFDSYDLTNYWTTLYPYIEVTK